MSVRTEKLKQELHEIERRIKIAHNEHTSAKAAFARLEVPVTHPMWQVFRDRVDSTLTHQRVLQALWHRTKAQLLEQQNTDHEVD